MVMIHQKLTVVHRVSNSVYIVEIECVPIVESTSNQQGEVVNEGQGQEDGEQREGQEDNERREVEQNHEQTQLEGATAPIPCTETSSDHSKYIIGNVNSNYYNTVINSYTSSIHWSIREYGICWTGLL